MEFKGVIPKTILVKLTTRERTRQAIICLTACHTLAKDPSAIKYLISLDIDDPTANHEFIETLRATVPNPMIVFGSSNNKIHAINRDINEFKEHWDILVNLSDDQICQVKDWDEDVRNNMPNDLNASLWFHDGLQNRINTMEIVGRAYFQRTGKIYDDSYKSFYCDEESTMVAKKLGKLIRSDKTLFLHDHPVGNIYKSEDQLYIKNQASWDEDKANFLMRWQYNFYV